MAISCGGLLCGVGFFVGFMVLSEMIEASVEPEAPTPQSIFGNVVFTGDYRFTSTRTGVPIVKEGRCQMRGISKSPAISDVAITSLSIHLRHDSTESEFGINSGMLLENESNVLEFYGRGHTNAFMFPLAGSEDDCKLDDVSIQFRLPASGTSFQSVGSVSSSDCSFKLDLTLQQVDLTKLKRKIVNYSIVNNALTLALIKLYIDQIRILDSSSNFSRIAIGSVVIQSIVDSMDSMMNFFIGLSIQFLFNIFIIIALFKFILFSFFEMRVIILAWRQIHANEINSLDPYEATRIERNWIQSRMYLPLLGCLLLLILWPAESAIPLVIASQLFWVPQIVHDAIKGHKSPLSNQFIVGVSVCRLILPIYVWGCPDSIFNGDVIFKPPGGAGVAITVFAIQAVQVFLLITQKMFGPRWFVPWMCLPHVYNYYRKVDMDEEFGVPECVVCMSEIDLKTDKKNTVITPCGHLFHPQCLGEWMNLRQECPLCRRELPPIT